MRILGLDGGIASIGWALVDVDDSGKGEGAIRAAGTWMFDPPEEKGQSGTKLKSAQRRLFRGQRRVVRRRRQRMNEVRRLFAAEGLLPSADRDALKHPGLDPWRLRVAALERKLNPVELAVALGHIARHRAFKSNAKGAAGANAPDDGKKMLKASAETREKLARYGTPARMLLEDESFVERGVRRLRNRDGEYSRSLLRDDLAVEVREIFRAQRRLGAGMASERLEAGFMDVAFHQRPLQDSDVMVGECPFEKGEKRSARRAPSFELFRLLAKLTSLTVIEAREARRLKPEELAAATAEFGMTAGISFHALRRKIGLPASALFEGVKPDEEKKRDVVARSGEASEGTARLRRLIADRHGDLAWQSLCAKPEVLDRVAQAVSFRDDLDRIAAGLDDAGVDPAIRATLVEAAAAGKLDLFTGAGHISAKAARAIIPGLLRGLTYDKACAEAGYDHTDSLERHAFDVGATGKDALARILKQERVSRELVGSPTARKAIIEMLKQVKAVIEEHGLPDRIHIELARDVGKSIEERSEIERGIEKRNRQKDKMRALFADKIGRPPQDGSAGAEELLRFELWEQQGGWCLYNNVYISPEQLVAKDNSVQVDHILPWSRFGDDSFHNKTLCTAKANQDKKGRTPFEWFQADRTPEEWDRFVAGVQAVPYMKGMKRRNYLLRNAEEAAERFRSRNLNDTRWACRLLAEALRQVLPDGADADGIRRRRVFVRPGALTDRLRRAWGLQWIKKDDKGARIPDDRHHALDAIVVAATTESLLNRATREVQENERKGLPYDLTKSITPPWPGFREAAEAATAQVFVARAERRRVRGAAHEATIRQVRERDGRTVVYERRKIADLKPADLERIKDRDRNLALVASLAAWIEAGKPADAPPLSPNGDPVVKVRLVSKSKVNVELRTGGADGRPGTVDRGEMARVDVFRKRNAKGQWQFYLVPIYPHEVATLSVPPNRAVTAHKDEQEWPIMDLSYEYCFPLNSFCLIEVVRRTGEVVSGYYRGMDRGSGNVEISAVANSSDIVRGIGARSLIYFRKFAVDRLGRTFDVERETRTWRGAACI